MDRDLRAFPAGKMLISPSILAADFSRLGEEIASVERGGADLLHLDVMDGHLVPNLSFGPPVVRSIRKVSRLLFDTHLMIEEPLRYIASFAEAGSDHITFHLESKDDTATVIAALRRLERTVGISIRPGTPPEALLPYLEHIDMILIMTVEPGFGGQRFMPETMGKVKFLARCIQERSLNVRLEVDGGLTEETAPLARAAGANVIVAGSSVFHAADPSAAIRALRGYTNLQS